MLRFQIVQTNSSIAQLANIAKNTYLYWQDQKLQQHHRTDISKEIPIPEQPELVYQPTAQRIWNKWRNVGAHVIVILRDIPAHPASFTSTTTATSRNTKQKDPDHDLEDEEEQDHSFYYSNPVFSFPKNIPHTTTSMTTPTITSSSSLPPLYEVVPFRAPENARSMQQYAYAHAATHALYMALRNNHRSSFSLPFTVMDHRHELFVHTRAFRNQFIHQERTDQVIAILTLGYTYTQPSHQQRKQTKFRPKRKKYDFTNRGNPDHPNGMVMDIIDYCF
jgi:hypothetical protein